MNSRYLYQLVHGEKPPRKPPQRSSGRGPARNWKYRGFIRSLPCAACGSTYDVEAAHTGTDRGMAQKASDYSCIPLCSDCHTQAPDSHHRDRQACEDRIFARHNTSVAQLVKSLNREWRLGIEESA